jgi:hypothetical protein
MPRFGTLQAEYSRNLLFRSGGQLEDLFDRVLDRTRSRLDIPTLRTLFSLKNRPHCNRAAGPPVQEIVIEKPHYGLSWFRVRFGMLQLKAYTKASTSCASRPPSTTPGNCAAAAAWTTSPKSSPASPAWPNGSPPPSTAPTSASSPTAPSMSCPALPHRRHPHRRHRLEQAPPPRRPRGSTRTGRRTTRIHRRRTHRQGPRDDPAGRLHQPASRLRSTQAPRQRTRGQASQDTPLSHPASGSPHHRRPARPRHRVGHRRHPQSRRGRKPAHWTAIDRDSETLRIGMQTLFHDLGIATPVTAAA